MVLDFLGTKSYRVISEVDSSRYSRLYSAMQYSLDINKGCVCEEMLYNLWKCLNQNLIREDIMQLLRRVFHKSCGEVSYLAWCGACNRVVAADTGSENVWSFKIWIHEWESRSPDPSSEQASRLILTAAGKINWKCVNFGRSVKLQVDKNTTPAAPASPWFFFFKHSAVQITATT